MAKLWAIREGLKYAWNKAYKYIHLQVDSKLAHNWITNLNSFFPLEYSNLIHDCKSLLERPWVVKTNHIWRESQWVYWPISKGRSRSNWEWNFLWYMSCVFDLMLFLGLTRIHVASISGLYIPRKLKFGHRKFVCVMSYLVVVFSLVAVSWSLWCYHIV